jgi:hypothetical protein
MLEMVFVASSQLLRTIRVPGGHSQLRWDFANGVAATASKSEQHNRCQQRGENYVYECYLNIAGTSRFLM